MIRGLGMDLVEVARLRGAADRLGDRFLERILRPSELAYCRSYRDPAPHVAVRFAAKEAVAKMFGTGIGEALTWHDMEVVNLEGGRPELILHDGGSRLLAAGGGGRIHLTLTHTEHYASAVAVWDQP